EPVIGGVDLWLGSCDMDDYRVADTRAQELRAHEAGPSAIAAVSGRPASVSFRVRGVGGVPSITVIGPRGQAVTPAATFADDQSATLFVAVSKPAPGTYTLQAAPGTPAIGEVAVSRQVAPAAIVRARVAGRGRAPPPLTSRARSGANQSTACAGRSRAGTRRIGTARAGTRRLRFTPGPGPGGRRDIVALVSQNGLVRSERTVARFSAPPPARVGRARGLRVRRAGRSLVATWRPGAGLAAQRVQVALADGRVIVRALGPRTGRITVAGVRRADRVRVSVIGQARDGRLGAPAQRGVRVRGSVGGDARRVARRGRPLHSTECQTSLVFPCCARWAPRPICTGWTTPSWPPWPRRCGPRSSRRSPRPVVISDPASARSS
ncbi:MAG TPA: hypothetical protein PKE32_06120, partial [Miltoncostaeaceae bacterium]|nr:hypothetical protein [Miltoncostaeaceae bacterium]